MTKIFSMQSPRKNERSPCEVLDMEIPCLLREVWESPGIVQYETFIKMAFKLSRSGLLVIISNAGNTISVLFDISDIGTLPLLYKMTRLEALFRNNP